MLSHDDRYVMLARDLAEALKRYVRDRRYEDQKEVARLQSELCALRREELALLQKVDDDQHQPAAADPSD